jgi:sec-independent protein translocase protein TatC
MVGPPDSVEMPFLDHLEELRWRIIWALLALIIAMGVALVVLLKIDVIYFLEKPILPLLNGHKLVYTHPGDPFSILLSTTFAFGLALALPFIFYQLWAFVAPALYRHERRLVIPVLMGATLLFLCGAALAYVVVLPLSVKWLMGFNTGSLEPMITASEYFSFTVSLVLAFGAAFELPVVILLLAAIGLVNPKMLNKYRRHAVFLAFGIGAFLTPGDMVWTTIAMAFPLWGLYELSVIGTFFIHRRRERRARAEAAADADPAPDDSRPHGLIA